VELDEFSDRLVLPVEIPAGVSPTEFYRGYTPPRFKLPSMRPGQTWRLEIGGEEVYLRSGEYPDGTLGEIFIDWGRQGSTMRGLTTALSIALSQALQHGVPLDRFVNAFRGHAFEPRGVVSGHHNLKMADSVIDGIVRVLGHYYLGRTDLVQVKEGGFVSPLITDADSAELLPSEPAAEAAETPATKVAGQRIHGKVCSGCGSSNLIQTGTCSSCGDCGETSGCG
jgi:ribonucleoside-diphosphate reductase alpha chain